jgi:hypothetical protein
VQERYRALAIESQPGLARVLRGVAAKRAIVALHRPVENMRIPRTEFCDCQTYVLYVRGLKWPCDTLKYLAAVYADHPDYKQTWRIEA